jgi:co-chaperonin GroES (HSP10)
MKVDNPTKIRACAHRVLVRVEKPKSDLKSERIHIPKEILEKTSTPFSYGVVVEIGSTAFKDYGDGHDWCDVGDTVLFVRHAGTLLPEDITGKLEHDYRMLNDIDIFGVKDE